MADQQAYQVKVEYKPTGETYSRFAVATSKTAAEQQIAKKLPNEPGSQHSRMVSG
ncbi:hypothetical protein [Streptomyces ortus]|uniref:DUF1508 domain-containing protein n=1 Tax=Streptomyces ortus TaxID=2867268 RepID=A0ABT3UW28_9ACTN|nr:hypothetical protein [Streptomyces ortus]MCX4231787.1 hypothetical protein [Streptomyces ortus]